MYILSVQRAEKTRVDPCSDLIDIIKSDLIDIIKSLSFYARCDYSIKQTLRKVR